MNKYQNIKQLAELAMFEELVTQSRKETIFQKIQRVPNGFVLHSYDVDGNTSVFIPIEDHELFSMTTSKE